MANFKSAAYLVQNQAFSSLTHGTKWELTGEIQTQQLPQYTACFYLISSLCR